MANDFDTSFDPRGRIAYPASQRVAEAPLDFTATPEAARLFGKVGRQGILQGAGDTTSRLGFGARLAAYAANPLVGLGLDIFGLIGSTYNQIVARREAREAKAQYQKDYDAAVATEAARFKQQQELVMKQFGLKKSEFANKLSRQREDDKRFWDQTNQNRYQQYQDKWLAMMNDPNVRAGFLSAMRGR
jgi:hypothetical protein